MALFSVIAAVSGVKAIAKALKKKKKRGSANIRALAGLDAPPPTRGATFPVGADIQIIPDTEFDLDPLTGEVTQSPEKRRRRRRRRMLTCADRADIAFVVGILGKGQAGSSAVTQLMSRCN